MSSNDTTKPATPDPMVPDSERTAISGGLIGRLQTARKLQPERERLLQKIASAEAELSAERKATGEKPTSRMRSSPGSGASANSGWRWA